MKKEEIKVKVTYTEGFEKRFTKSCIDQLKKREEQQLQSSVKQKKEAVAQGREVQMEALIMKLNKCIQEEYDRMKESGYSEKKVEQLIRDVRWTEPELAAYIKKKIGKMHESEAIRQNKLPQ